MRFNEIIESFSAGSFDDSKISYKWVYDNYFVGSSKIVEVNDNIALYKNNNTYLLVKESNTILGLIKLSSVSINHIMYNNVDMIYVFPEYRNTSAIKWLIFSVKEESDYPIIADGAIFNKGESLIKSIVNHHIMKVSILNKSSGEIEPYSGTLMDIDKCYLFERFGSGYSTKFLDESGPTVWYNFFD